MMDFSEFDQFEEYRLLNDNCQHPVILLKHQKTGAFFVQKEVPVTMMPVFLELKKRSQMIHSGLPEIIGLMEMGEHLFVIEKYIEGKNLEDDIRDHFLLQEESIRIILRLCEILETLHGQDPPMIHRDIKPSNVILGHDGGVFLIDFGASRFVKDGVESDTVFLGTTGYASPEQYGFHQSDQRSDIYSLGILLNVLLTGKYPNEKMADAPYDQVIQKCTQIEPKDRYQNVRQLKQALKRANTLAERKFFREKGERERTMIYHRIFNFNDHSQKATWLVRGSDQIFYVQKAIDLSLRPVYEALQMISHQEGCGIPKIIEISERDGKLIIVEEWINGRTLADILSEKYFLPDDVLTISLRLCTILQRLHQHSPQIIHRDLKPSNVILTEKGEVYLLDFDASRFFSPGETKDTTQLGTAGYAPPEQYGFGQCDARSDIYALGVLMNVLLTGEYPNDKMAGLPFSPVIHKCIEMDMDRRYQSVEELLSVLQGFRPKKFNQEEKENTIEKNADVKSWAIPGFRSRTPWKMIVAILSYLGIIGLSIALKDSASGYYVSIAVGTTLLWMVLLFFNYRNICQQLPFLRTKNFWLRLLGILFWSFCFFSVIIIVLIAIQSIIKPI